jgi:hypothetical protein
MAAPGHGEEPLTVPSANRTGEVRPPIGIVPGVGGHADHRDLRAVKALRPAPAERA